MLSTRKFAAIGTMLSVAASSVALAQDMADHQSLQPDHQQMMQSGHQVMGPGQTQEMTCFHQGMMPMGGHAEMHGASTTPTRPGQDAFGAIQEVVRTLDADPIPTGRRSILKHCAGISST